MVYKINVDDVDNLDRGYALEVEMDKTEVYTDKDNEFFAPDSGVVILYTQGVGPCIAFLASGRYYLDTDDKTGHYFTTLWHYSGEEQSLIKEEDLLQLGRKNIKRFFNRIALELGDDEDITIVVHQLCFIGGQKKDENCCGTKKEVRALEAALQQADPFNAILPENMRIDESLKPECHFFPSHGEACVDIYVQREGDTSMKISYKLIDNNPLPLVAAAENRENQAQSPISPAKSFFGSPKGVDNSSGKRKAPLTPPANAPPEKRKMLFKP